MLHNRKSIALMIESAFKFGLEILGSNSNAVGVAPVWFTIKGVKKTQTSAQHPQADHIYSTTRYVTRKNSEEEILKGTRLQKSKYF